MPPTKKQNMTAEQKLDIYNDKVFHFRERVTIANINAGYTLLPAVRGYKYRVIDMAMIAIGGAAAAATAVRINGVQSGSTVQLLSTAIAALTRSAVNYPGLANNTILADGASFVENDAETAITVDKSGASITTATHIDFSVSYALVKA